MQRIHIRNIFSLFVPLTYRFDAEAVPLIGSNKFGFVIAEKNSTTNYQYHLQLFYEDLNFIKEKEAPNPFSWAKRNAIQFQRTDNSGNIEGIVLRIRVNHGIFDFRKIDDQTVRIQVTRLCNHEFTQEGSSAMLQLMPKNRNGVSNGEPVISAAWIENREPANQLPTINNLNVYNSAVYESYESPAVDAYSQVPSSSDQIQLFEHSSDGLASPHSYQLSLLAPGNENYMVLYNGNAEVVGNFRALNFYKASDINIKEDVRLLVEDRAPRATLLKIDGVDYKFKKGINMDTNRRFVGYIAQQVESVVPEAVQLIDGILHVDYESLIPYLSESIRANFEDIKDLRSKNGRLHFVVGQLYEQFVKETQTPYNITKPEPTRKGTATRPKLSILWRVVIASICVLGLMGLVLALTLHSQSDPNVIDLTPLSPSYTEVHDVMHYELDRVFLAELFNATGGPNWINNTGWMTDQHVCEWYGVECSKTAMRVITLHLVANNLAGILPAGLAYNDSFIEELILKNNSLTGSIPDEICYMKNLKKLDLSHNNIQGAIPLMIGDEVGRLHKLDLSHNNIGGLLPYSITTSTSLFDVDLSHNRISGLVPPFSIMSRISFLDLSHNSFDGTLSSFGPEMSYIGLENNSFIGSMFPLESAFALESLSLDHNQFSGEFELSENQNRQLKFLQISHNKFTSFSTKGVALWSSKIWCDATKNDFECPMPNIISSRCFVSCAK